MALAETKRLLRSRQPDLEFGDLLQLSARFFASEEGQEGIASFREKRPARWVPARRVRPPGALPLSATALRWQSVRWPTAAGGFPVRTAGPGPLRCGR